MLRLLLVQSQDFLPPVAWHPTAAWYEKRKSEHRAGRGARDHIEDFGDRLTRAALDLGQDEGRHDAVDTATIDRENADRAICVRYLFLYPSHVS